MATTKPTKFINAVDINGELYYVSDSYVEDNYLPLTGNQTLTGQKKFTDETNNVELGSTSAGDSPIQINYDNNNYYAITLVNAASNSTYKIDAEAGQAEDYYLTLPSKTGTIALRTDIPTVNNATLTIQKNGTNVATFTANSSTNQTANIIVPTKVSELTNDSGYLTSHQDISGKVNKSGDTMTGDLSPSTNKGASLGTSSLYWNDIYGTTIYENGTSLVNKYAAKSHTHNYAASDTAGGSANSVKNALTFGSKTYNGSTAQTITASDLGALTAHQDISGKVNKSGDTMTGSLTISSGSITAPQYNDAHNWPVIKVVDDSVTQISNSYTSTRIYSDTQPEWWLMGSSQGVLALKSDIPSSLKNPNALTFGSKTYDGSTAQTITASDLDAVSKSDAITSVTWTDTAGELNFKNSAGTTKSTITLPISHYFGTTYGECYTIDAPNAEYSMQIGESGFTVDSEIPGYDHASKILQVNNSVFTYDGNNVLHTGNATKMASFYDHKVNSYVDIRTNQGSLTTNGITIIVRGQVTLAGVTNLRLAHSMPNANYALFFTEVSSSSNAVYVPIVRSKSASDFSVYISSGGIVYDYVAIYVG